MFQFILPSLYKKNGKKHSSGKVINPKEIILTEMATKINDSINCRPLIRIKDH